MRDVSREPVSSWRLIPEKAHIQTAPGVTLSDSQHTIVSSILDLFAGSPSLPKLALWRDDATFADNLTVAEGRERYSAQWYGLKQVFSEIDQLSYQVRDAGNPIVMDLRTRYIVKGINKEMTVQSVVNVHLDGEGKISKVEDKWDGELPEGSVANAFRRLRGVAAPKMVSVPKDDAEDAEKGNQ
ncbi:hypothetical protein P153DRAFT_375357 [Dothidotthia symphoricarpi CBS 119687]|uniref:SnoaL-like domain-containing protein n=1 Tax=Dothidotthia symphoricarpi CBS 119687 TaxID=1392245 RepID=A0A6A6AID0_9PLEO|nr:uncharacterized protein P153DRAFT_375357 [Dothidotthia symphoricarpi CBS 119687]KAF2130654.1 hypothetical protein P153DRAFT_375357 [Dothidotthia symphoricarpi CBS 119687]